MLRVNIKEFVNTCLPIITYLFFLISFPIFNLILFAFSLHTLFAPKTKSSPRPPHCSWKTVLYKRKVAKSRYQILRNVMSERERGHNSCLLRTIRDTKQIELFFEWKGVQRPKLARNESPECRPISFILVSASLSLFKRHSLADILWLWWVTANRKWLINLAG